jgi:hypothetical protein
MSTLKFVVSHMDQQMGPFDEQELKGKWVKGEILPIDYVYDEDLKDWVLLAERFAWAAQVQGDDIMPPPPAAGVRTESVVTRRLNADLTAKFAAPANVATPAAPAAATAPATTTATPAATAPAVTASLPVVTPELAPQPAPTTVEVIKMNQETVRLQPAPTKVKLTNGFGEIDLSPMPPGRVAVTAQDSVLTGHEPLHIQVKPAEPVEVVWSFANQQTVGQDLEIQMKALDEQGRICLGFNDHFTLQIRGGVSKDVMITTVDGLSTLRLHQEKAENWSLQLTYSGSRRLRMPEKRAVEWQAGPASKLVIEGPSEYTAGLPLKVQVRAVDLYGNTAKQYQGTVVLEVKAS